MLIGKDIGTKWLVNFLIQSYFMKLRSILIIYNSNNLSALQIDYLNGISETFNKFSPNYVIVQWINVGKFENESLNETVLQHIELGTEGYISLLSNPTEFLNARYFSSQISIQRLKDKFFLFFTEMDNAKLFFNENNLKYFPSHILLVKGNEDFKIWTQNYVGYEDEENTRPLLLNIYFMHNKTFLYNSNLYPNKLDNLKGRVVRVAAMHYVPYVVTKLVESGKGNVDAVNTTLPRKNIIYNGCEGNIILEFCVLRNCTINVEPLGNDEWGNIHEDGSSDGMVGSVYRKESEFALGSIYNWYSAEFEVSFGIAKSAVRIMGPGPNRYPSYLTNILPFSSFVWLSTLVSIMFSSIVLYLNRFSRYYFISKKEDQSSNYQHMNIYIQSLLGIFAIFFQQSYPLPDVNGFIGRFFLTTLLIAALTLENSYSGHLKSLLTVPLFMDPVDTFEKFTRTNWNWGAPADAWVLSICNSDIPTEKIMSDKFEIHSVEKLKNFTYTKNFGFSVEKLHGEGYTFGNYIRDGGILNLIILKEDLFYEYTRGIGVRGWPLMDGVNTMILRCLEHGLYLYWEKKFLAQYIDRKTQQIILALDSGHIEKPSPETLNLYHISGPFIFLILSWFLSVAIFLFEILVKKCY